MEQTTLDTNEIIQVLFHSYENEERYEKDKLSTIVNKMYKFLNGN